ncbi:DUF930 domain-containing protein [Rhodoplanes sp. Z2-YC6860]|uniref:DUF930 domain-containing protein n=1 Tax=Rhodoplanes sp. Z2-YC6860 TaxID=674703 RepID=UPI00078E0F97|nr:DUF930 domain-containing protein [Rhodoplanes sp. Z2-YC6860]AMN42090.1 hypothetical protein RHPLAN_36580 [Rhodoplanes sp. Z2-YC6860]
MRFWKILALALIVALAGSSIAADAKTKRTKTAAVSKAGVNEKFRKALDRLDPQTRLEQICDLEAMNRIKKDQKFSPDRAQGAASADPKTDGHKLTATGGAFRSKGDWYELSFVCEATPDHMKVLSFEYQTGKSIPKAKWEEYGLF